jgi:hypothetical protein
MRLRVPLAVSFALSSVIYLQQDSIIILRDNAWEHECLTEVRTA